jgi:non-ribosomal peptide synthetase component F
MQYLCDNVTPTYQELDDRADALALRLQRGHGVGPGTLVALVLERSEHVLISILAVLKAGAAYAPIAPDTRDKRIKLIFTESRPRVVLTDVEHIGRLTDIADAARLVLDVLPAGNVVGDERSTPADPEPLAGARVGPDSLTYVIPLSAIVSGAPMSIRFRLVHAAELSDADYMTDLLNMQRHLLDKALAGWERPWREVGLLSETRRGGSRPC